MTIGELIMQKRKNLNLTLEDVGNAVGVSKATVSRWESGDIHKMKRDKIEALSNVLGIDPVMLVRTQEVLTNDEMHLLTAYRSASREARGYAMDILEKSAAERKQKETGSSSARTAS